MQSNIRESFELVACRKKISSESDHAAEKRTLRLAQEGNGPGKRFTGPPTFTKVFARLPAMNTDIEGPYDLGLPSQALLYEPSMCQ